MGYHEHKHLAPENVSCAVVTISDSRTEADDESGRFIRERLTEGGHRVVDHAIIKNDADAVRGHVRALAARDDVQVIITSGGTGISHRDVTVDTVLPMLEKRLDGFGELFRQLTYEEIGTGSIMSRAIAGVIGGTSGAVVVVCFPGSLGAAKLAVNRIILPEIGHLVREATR
jgi:molybdenum cofactor biosynthesis protein B